MMKSPIPLGPGRKASPKDAIGKGFESLLKKKEYDEIRGLRY